MSADKGATRRSEARRLHMYKRAAAQQLNYQQRYTPYTHDTRALARNELQQDDTQARLDSLAHPSGTSACFFVTRRNRMICSTARIWSSTFIGAVVVVATRTLFAKRTAVALAVAALVAAARRATATTSVRPDSPRPPARPPLRRVLLSPASLLVSPLFVLRSARCGAAHCAMSASMFRRVASI